MTRAFVFVESTAMGARGFIMLCPPFRLPVPFCWFLANLIPGHVINASQDQLLVIEGHPAEHVWDFLVKSKGVFSVPKRTSCLSSLRKKIAPNGFFVFGAGGHQNLPWTTDAQVTPEPGQSACSFRLPGSYALQGVTIVEKAKKIEETPCCNVARYFLSLD